MEIFTNIIYRILRVFRPSLFKIQSFTYYIPAPPRRKSGYREKEFDKTFYYFINLGFDIIDYKTIGHNSDKQSGFWVCFLLRAKNLKASKLDLNDHYLNEEALDQASSEAPPLEVYYENEEAN